MSTQISARTAASTLTGAETLGIIQGGADRRVTLALAAGDYVTPEKYGAVGDGTTDDTTAFQAALNTGAPGVFAKNTYKITTGLTLAIEQVLFGLPRSEHGVPFPYSGPRIIFRPGAANKVCIKNGTESLIQGCGVKDMVLDLDDNSHTGIQLYTTYASLVDHVQFLGTMRIGVLISDNYESTLRSCVFHGTSVRTACIFIGVSNATTIEKLHTSVAVNDTGECLYGIAVQAGGDICSIRDCIMQGPTIGIATNTLTAHIDSVYNENTLCCLRLGDPGTSAGIIKITGGVFTPPFNTHPQYSSRGPEIYLNCDTVTIDTPKFGDAAADAASSTGPWPILLNAGGGPQRVTLINPFHFSGAATTYARDLLIQKNGGTSASIVVLGSDYSHGTHHAQEIILKKAGAYNSTCYGIQVDNSGAVVTSAYTPATAAAAVNALLETNLPTGASLKL